MGIWGGVDTAGNVGALLWPHSCQGVSPYVSKARFGGGEPEV